MESEREPLFRAPWPVLSLLVVLLAAYGMQRYVGADDVALRLGFSPASLSQGRIAPLFTALFVHGGWAHVLVNSAFIMAFGAPVSRRLGLDFVGAGAFLAFFLVCGALANLGYAAAHPGDVNVVVGASGAAAGLMGAAARLMTRGPGLAPLLSRPVVGMTGAWVGINGLLGVAQALGVAGLAPGAGGALVAWEAHLFGYAAGLLLFAPLLWIIRRA